MALDEQEELEMLTLEREQAQVGGQGLRTRLAPILRETEKRHGLPPGLLDYVAEQESGWNPYAVNPKSGAAGLFQFMKPTAAQYGLRDPHDPETSARTAGRYLGNLRNQFGGSVPDALAAYNWGPGNLKKHGAGAMPPETRNYVDKIMRKLGMPQAEAAPDPEAAVEAVAPPRAAQADVRKAEPRVFPMERQRELEAERDANFKAWHLATGGKLKPGQNVQDAVTEWSGKQHPGATRSAAEIEHLRETGELEGYEDTLGYKFGKPAASLAGFMVKGPAGATGAETLVRYVALTKQLNRAMAAGAIDEDRAGELLWQHMRKGIGEDALFNFGVPLLGKIAAKVPGATWVQEKVGKLIQSGIEKATLGLPKEAAVPGVRAVVPGAPKPSLRDLKLEHRADLVDDPAQKEAIAELGRRTKEVVPTPGQVTGEASLAEKGARLAHPNVFERQERVIAQAADDFLHETTAPASQMEVKELGGMIKQIALDTQKAVKARLRPAFDAADNLGVKVDMREARQIASKALLADARVGGGKLKAAERLDLENVFEDFRTAPYATPEAAIDFISRRKELRRGITAVEKPSEAFGIALGQLAGSADKAFKAAAAGEGTVARDLMRARGQYGEMMDTIYKGTVKQILKTEPEKIGRLIWSSGNVTEIEQVHRMLRMAEREGVTGAAGGQKVRLDVARGFLQEGMRDLDSAARWSQMLKEDSTKRRTWAALTAGADGQGLVEGVRVVEEAAKIALRDNPALARGQAFIPLSRAAKGGLGVSLVTGAMHAGMMVAGIASAGALRAMATAYTQGNKGMANLIRSTLRANSAGTAAGAKAVQEAVPKIQEWAVKHGITDLFVTEGEETK